MAALKQKQTGLINELTFNWLKIVWAGFQAPPKQFKFPSLDTTNYLPLYITAGRLESSDISIVIVALH